MSSYAFGTVEEFRKESTGAVFLYNDGKPYPVLHLRSSDSGSTILSETLTSST
jgi:hypothetical protein